MIYLALYFFGMKIEFQIIFYALNRIELLESKYDQLSPTEIAFLWVNLRKIAHVMNFFSISFEFAMFCFLMKGKNNCRI